MPPPPQPSLSLLRGVSARLSGSASMVPTSDSLGTDGHTIGCTGVCRRAVGEPMRIRVLQVCQQPVRCVIPLQVARQAPVATGANGKAGDIISEQMCSVKKIWCEAKLPQDDQRSAHRLRGARSHGRHLCGINLAKRRLQSP